MKKVALVILDGWGLGDKTAADAIAHAKTPFFDNLMKRYPNATLQTSGENVGLPDGQMGNSEVGHLNIGAGRIVYQDLVKINKAIKDKSFFKNKALLNAFDHAIENKAKVHFMGLVSDGGVHSHINHLYALLEMAKEAGVASEHIAIHAFTDGRDTDPKSGLSYLTALKKFIEELEYGNIASVIGRYYAMDRDKRWERVKKAYDMLVEGKGDLTEDVLESVRKSYDDNITDEFIEPIVCKNVNGNVTSIKDGDIVICFNYRTDRCREITMALTQEEMPDHGMHTLPLYYLTMTNYDNKFKGIHIAYDKDNLQKTLGEVLAKERKTQVRIAETEKYPHVTFFFSGGREKEFENEKRIMIPSPKVATYDLQPEMSAPEVTEAIVKEIDENQPDFICLNYANPDMVGHTGVYSAIVKAVETVDSCLEKIVSAGLEKEYSFIIIADHGNADFTVNEDGTPNTAHTTNPVPVILIDNDHKKIKDGILADVAPSILDLYGIKVPDEMTGKSLV